MAYNTHIMNVADIRLHFSNNRKTMHAGVYIKYSTQYIIIESHQQDRRPINTFLTTISIFVPVFVFALFCFCFR